MLFVISSRTQRALKVALPFGAFLATGFAYLKYTSQTRYDSKKQRQAEAAFQNIAKYRLKTVTAEQIYEEEIAGKTFEDYRNIRGPHIGEDNSEYERIVAEQKRKGEEQREQLRQKRLKLIKELERASTESKPVT